MSGVLWQRPVNWLPIPILPRLTLQVAVGTVMYVGLAILLKNSAFTYIWNRMRKMIKKKESNHVNIC